MRQLALPFILLGVLALAGCAPTAEPSSAEEASAPAPTVDMGEGELLLVHMFPGDGEAVWRVHGEEVARTGDVGETAGFFEVPAGVASLTVAVDGSASAVTELALQSNARYVAYLHMLPDGSPAVVTGEGMTQPVGDAAWGRFVNLVPNLENVELFNTSSCLGDILQGRRYGGVIRYSSHHPWAGHSTACSNGQPVAGLPSLSGTGTAYMYASAAQSILLYLTDEGPALMSVDETP